MSIDTMQMMLVGHIQRQATPDCIRFDFDTTKPMRVIIGDILERANARNQGGPVAQHLVGAKLAIRFPHMQIGNFSHSAADEQAGRQGDFFVGTTAFHVTVAPTLGHVGKCKKNVREGLAAMFIVTDAKIATARALLETEGIQEKVAVESVESFLGQNISELAEFAPASYAERLGQLLREYNRRVTAVETDGSLLIGIPALLGGEED